MPILKTMRLYYFLPVLVFTFTNAYSQTKGYIITLKNDTTWVQVKRAGFLSFKNANKQVEIVDSSGSTQIFKPGDIKAYAYNHKSKDYIYASKPIENGDFKFLEAVVVGPKTSLYQYVVALGGNYSNQEFYTFERSNGAHLFMTNFAGLNAFQEKLSVFYNDIPEVHQLIYTKFHVRKHIQRDIKLILAAVNQSATFSSK